jgi:hypothetical protein
MRKLGIGTSETEAGRLEARSCRSCYFKSYSERLTRIVWCQVMRAFRSFPDNDAIQGSCMHAMVDLVHGSEAALKAFDAVGANQLVGRG